MSVIFMFTYCNPAISNSWPTDYLKPMNLPHLVHARCLYNVKILLWLM